MLWSLESYVHHFACQLRSIDVIISIKKDQKSIVDTAIDTFIRKYRRYRYRYFKSWKVSSIVSISISIFDINNPGYEHTQSGAVDDNPNSAWRDCTPYGGSVSCWHTCLFIYLSVCQSICLSVCLSVCLYVCPPPVCLSVYISIYSFLYLCIYLFIRLMRRGMK